MGLNVAESITWRCRRDYKAGGHPLHHPAGIANNKRVLQARGLCFMASAEVRKPGELNELRHRGVGLGAVRRPRSSNSRHRDALFLSTVCESSFSQNPSQQKQSSKGILID